MGREMYPLTVRGSRACRRPPRPAPPGGGGPGRWCEASGWPILRHRYGTGPAFRGRVRGCVSDSTTGSSPSCSGRRTHPRSATGPDRQRREGHAADNPEVEENPPHEINHEDARPECPESGRTSRGRGEALAEDADRRGRRSGRGGGGGGGGYRGPATTTQHPSVDRRGSPTRG